MIDSHCHLDFPDFATELDGVLNAARAQGVGHFLTIGTGMSRFAGVRTVAERASDIHCTVGIHPHESAAEPLSSPDPLLKEAEHEKVVGFGEAGLDFYYKHSPREPQINNFRHHIAAARIAKLPLVVHTRDAEDDTAENDDDDVDAMTDNVGDASVEINVEDLINEIELQGIPRQLDKEVAARRRLEELMEQRRAKRELEDFEDYEI